MTMSANEPAAEGPIEGDRGQVRILDLSLPVPENSSERLRALSFLNETVNRYIGEFCDPENLVGRHAKGTLAAHVAAARGAASGGVSMPQAVQVFLCFSICLFI